MNVTWPGAQAVSGSSNRYSIHYLGQYPIAEMQCWDHHPARPWHPHPTAAQKQGRFFCEPMPLEASADNLLLTAMAARAMGNDSATAIAYWPTMRELAQYVKENGRDPVLQLYTDDYLGPSANNSNLAAKATISLAAYAQLCEMVPDSLCNATEAEEYDATARAYATYWLVRTSGGRGGATKRTYNDPPGVSFSAKTNLLWDALLGTKLFPLPALMEKECATYLATAAPYGWLLDERGLRTNKTNIETELSASLCSPAASADLYRRTVRMLAVAEGGWAFADTYDATTGARLGGEGRSQVGGVFGRLAIARMNPRWRERDY